MERKMSSKATTVVVFVSLVGMAMAMSVKETGDVKVVPKPYGRRDVEPKENGPFIRAVPFGRVKPVPAEGWPIVPPYTDNVEPKENGPFMKAVPYGRVKPVPTGQITPKEPLSPVKPVPTGEIIPKKPLSQVKPVPTGQITPKKPLSQVKPVPTGQITPKEPLNPVKPVPTEEKVSKPFYRSVPGCIANKSFKPVCGTDGNSYINDDFFKCARQMDESLKVRHVGDCKN